VSLKRLSGSELAAVIGGALLALGLFLNWYDLANRRTELNGVDGPATLTGFEAHEILRWAWLAAAAAPIILAYIIVRGHKLSWARGEMTAVISIAAFGLLVYQGVIDRPGDPQSLVSLQLGWFVSLAGVLAMLIGSALRASTTERPRKPPGVL